MQIPRPKPPVVALELPRLSQVHLLMHTTQILPTLDPRTIATVLTVLAISAITALTAVCTVGQVARVAAPVAARAVAAEGAVFAVAEGGSRCQTAGT